MVWGRWTSACLGIALVVATTLLGVWSSADARLTEMRFGATTRAPSGDIIFVDLDAASIAAVGRWPWPRSVHAALLDRLMALGAYDVVFDIDFSTVSTPSEDQAFADSLERAGGYAFLAAFRQSDAAGGYAVNQPIEPFARFAKAVLVNIDSLEGGLVRSVPARSTLPSIQSLALTLSPRPEAAESVRIDYSIDLSRIVRVPGIKVLDGSVNPALIRDRQVVIGASAIELHDLFSVPRYGVIPGPLVQIAAAETIKLDRLLYNLGVWPCILVGTIILLALPSAMTLGAATATLAATAIAVELTSLLLLAALRLDMSTMPLHVACLAAVVFKFLADRLIRHGQLQEQRARLAYLANHDLRTGALSRTAMVDKLDELLRSGAAPTLLLIRIERIDAAGASLGYEVAEAVTAMVYARLRDAVPGLVARIEKDIFATSWPNPPSDASIACLMERLDHPYDAGGHRIALETRWGACANVSAQIGATEAMQQARMALAVATNRAIKGARYADAFEAELQQRQSLDIALRHAVTNGELDVAFQTQVDMRTQTVAGAEALLRWHSESHGTVSPALFIPLAEENGVIVQLGAWVVREACRRAVTLGWTGRLSVNISPRQFQLDDVVTMVRSALIESGFPANRLDVEVTESLFVETGPSLIAALGELRALGVSIAIDDFGTGYSSLSYLATLPVDKLKIDQSFVRALDNHRGAAVLEAIVTMSRGLGHQIVVEGVETQAQFDYLAGLGCDIAQGYLFGRPGDLPSISPKSVAA